MKSYPSVWQTKSTSVPFGSCPFAGHFLLELGHGLYWSPSPVVLHVLDPVFGESAGGVGFNLGGSDLGFGDIFGGCSGDCFGGCFGDGFGLGSRHFSQICQPLGFCVRQNVRKRGTRRNECNP